MKWIELLLALGLLAFVAAMWRILFADFRNGVVRRSYVTYARTDHPRSFWFWTVVNGSFIAVVTAAALAASAAVAVQFR